MVERSVPLRRRRRRRKKLRIVLRLTIPLFLLALAALLSAGIVHVLERPVAPMKVLKQLARQPSEPPPLDPTLDLDTHPGTRSNLGPIDEHAGSLP